MKTLRELLSVADFVTLHVPLSEGTTNMIGAEELQQMRKGRWDAILCCLMVFCFLKQHKEICLYLPCD